MSKFKPPIPDTPRHIISTSQDAWSREFETWLASHESENTRRAYANAWIAFRKHAGLNAMNAKTMHIWDWVKSMQEEMLSAASIVSRLAAISSFYKHAIHAGLCRYNPVDPVPRPEYVPYKDAQALDSDQTQAFLAAIPRSTRQGKRDFALFQIAIHSGRPVSEICQLRFGDFQPRGKQLWITWPKSDAPQPAPPIYWQSIRDFLADNGQLGSILSDDYIFTALSERAAHLPNVAVATWDSGQPLTAPMIGRLIKKYAKRAGLDPTRISAKTLRYTAVNLQNQFVSNPQILTDYLNYTDPYTAEQMLRQLQVNGHPPWQDVDSTLDS